MKFIRAFKNSYLKTSLLKLAPHLPKITMTMAKQPFFFISESFETKNPMKYYVPISFIILHRRQDS